jgi:hypothetical protein
MTLERFDIAGTDARVLDQYRNSPRVLALLRALIDEPAGELRAAFVQLLGRLNIDAMEGVQLDLIGRIVGRSRPDVFDPILVQDEGFFEFRGLEDASDPDLGFDSLINDGRRFEGAPFRSVDGVPLMSDPDYRELLKATIFLNNANATVQELETYGSFVLGTTVSVVNGFTVVDLEVAKRLSIQERKILDATLLPAAGIRIGNIRVADGEGAFGFAGGDRTTGFGAVGEEQIGAGFARVA